MRTIFIILLFLVSIAGAEENFTNITGIVVNSTGYVQYKIYQLPQEPTLKSGEYVVISDDIDPVLKGAKYGSGVFVNPKPVVYEEIELKAEKDPIDPTQTIISGLAGAGAAYFMVRRKKVS